MILGIAGGYIYFEMRPFTVAGRKPFQDLPGMQNIKGKKIGMSEVFYIRRFSFTYSGLVVSGECSREAFEEFGKTFQLKSDIGNYGASIPFSEIAGEKVPADIFLNFSERSIFFSDEYNSRNHIQMAWEPSTRMFSGIIVGDPSKEMTSEK